MRRLSLPHGRGLHPWRGAVLPLLMLGALLLAVAAGALARQAEEERPEEAAVLPHLANQPRHFYVTVANVQGNEALNSCAAGYHMSSLWEMLDPTGLEYADHLPGAKTLQDMGTGPVAGWWGWVRTGGDSYTANSAGRANCGLWTSVATGEYGTLVQLTDVWTNPATAISPWRAQTWQCSGFAPVWCVSDTVYGVWLPAVRK